MENFKVEDVVIKMLLQDYLEKGYGFEYLESDIFIKGKPANEDQEKEVANLMQAGIKFKFEVLYVGRSKIPFVTYDLDNLSYDEIQALSEIKPEELAPMA